MMKPSGDLSLGTCAALWLLFAAASCAPTMPADACVDVRSSALALNQYANTASVKARNGSTDMADFASSLDWMESKDMCDPNSLHKKSMTCVGKMFKLLVSYKSEVERISGLQNCLDPASIVKPALEKLHSDMKKCVKSLGEWKHETTSDTSTQPIKHWEEDFLCRYTLDRLFSFSILTARVFSVGDPSRHGEGSAQKCM